MVRSGVPVLRGQFSLDTRGLADGFHEITAVTFEGSHVQTQQRITLPVEVQNTSLQADLLFRTISESNSIGTPVSAAVTANNQNIASIQLFSTGGLIESSTNQSAATFPISGKNLGAGLHPFWALVVDSDRQQYRTRTRYMRFTNP